jgi:GntR family transcriptional regulator
MTRTQPLMIQIATGDARSIGRQIVDAVRRRIATGELTQGAQLPSVRALAQQLTVNANTVAKAYADLAAEGWLETRQGLGVFVAIPRSRLSEGERNRRLDEAIQRFVDESIALNVPFAEALARLEEEIDRLQSRQSA